MKLALPDEYDELEVHPEVITKEKDALAVLVSEPDDFLEKLCAGEAVTECPEIVYRLGS